MRTRSRWPLAAGLAAGVALDALFGDPRRGHPVAAFGRAAAALEARDYADTRRRGAAHAAACVLAVAGTAAREAGRRGRPPRPRSRCGRSPVPVRYIVRPNGPGYRCTATILPPPGTSSPACAA